MPEIGTSGLMSEEGKRSDAAWPKPPRLSSTLPLLKDCARRNPSFAACELEARRGVAPEWRDLDINFRGSVDQRVVPREGRAAATRVRRVRRGQAPRWQGGLRRGPNHRRPDKLTPWRS
jgi:hypothetical protein